MSYFKLKKISTKDKGINKIQREVKKKIMNKIETETNFNFHKLFEIK